MAEPFSKEMMSFVCSFCPRSLLFVCAANSTFYDSSQFNDVYVLLLRFSVGSRITRHRLPFLRKWGTPFPPSTYLFFFTL